MLLLPRVAGAVLLVWAGALSLAMPLREALSWLHLRLELSLSLEVEKFPSKRLLPWRGQYCSHRDPGPALQHQTRLTFVKSLAQAVPSELSCTKETLVQA